MKLANMLGDRFRETPADCQIISQIFMIRGGYMKQIAQRHLFAEYARAAHCAQN